MKKLLIAIATFFGVATASTGASAEQAHSVVGVQGYDLVSYHTGSKPLPGNGNHTVRHNGVNYLFSTAANKKTFAANPAKYLPAYGGWCAFGVAVGKKFIGDPTVWELVDDRLYFNLDNKVKGIWLRDVPGNIEKADATWGDIKEVPASKL